MRIGVCGELFSNNFGDPVIVESVRYIIENNINKSTITMIDLDGRTKFKKVTIDGKKENKLQTIKKAKEYLKFESLKSLQQFYYWQTIDKKRLSKYFYNKVREIDVLVIAGGQLIMNNNLNFPLRINLLIDIAKACNVKVIFNACGVQNAHRYSFGNKLIKSYLNKQNVVSISTRDDIEILQKYLYKSKVIPFKTLDPAIVTDKLYSIERNESSETIGLGVVAPSVYKKYSNRTKDLTYLVSEQFLIEFWIKIINDLDDKNIKWIFFTNGDINDYKFCVKVLEAMKMKKKIKHPQSPEELVNFISNFKGVISQRLHSQIISYSLNVPFVGIVWDKKLEDFGLSVNREKYYLNAKFINPNVCIELINEQIANNDNDIFGEVDILKKDTVSSLVRAIHNTNN